jgi:serine/threonine-protein kinase RsbW
MSETENAVRLTFPAKADYLLLARLALSGVARGASIDDELLADLKLAVTEACGNAVRHAYADGAGDVAVSYVVRDRTLEVIVEDRGAGIDPGRHPDGAIPGGGMGMSIMGAIADELEVGVGADGRGTVVRMVKRLAPAPA